MNTVYKIKSNKDLFKKLKEFDLDLAAIVQNDQKLTIEDIQKWRERYTTLLQTFNEEYVKKVRQFADAMQETIIYLEKCRQYDDQG